MEREQEIEFLIKPGRHYYLVPNEIQAQTVQKYLESTV